MKIKVALGQFNIQFAQPAANRARVRELVAAAADGEADVVVLPEMWNTGYALDKLPELADEGGRKRWRCFRSWLVSTRWESLAAR